jgi:hypothetical protein
MSSNTTKYDVITSYLVVLDGITHTLLYCYQHNEMDSNEYNTIDVRLPDGIPFGTVYIQKYDKMKHTETNMLIILNRNELVYDAKCRGWSACCTDGIVFVLTV